MLQLVSSYVGEGQRTILGPEADTAFAKLLWGVAAVYVSCTALRLARFNVETPSAAIEDHHVFRGLPSPGAAGAVASLIVLHQHVLANRDASVQDVSDAFARWTAFGIPFITLLCAVAMVSSMPYIHFANRYLRGQRSFAYVARLVIPLALAVWWFQEMLALAFTAYALSAPVRLGLARIRRRSS
ncbi:MAG: CDP-alcohol phosphatidyltransferase family protein, partial [Planctomycetota bacterium]|jgi:CDP-diacylglycerol--serine O-phosphatidyltransferase